MLALGEEDTEIAAMLKAAILKVADEKEADAQYYAQLPEGWEKTEEERWSPVFAKLDALTQADRKATPGVDIISSGDPEYKLTVREESEVAQALADYKSSCDAMLNKPVTTGRHFNPNLQQRAFQIYDDHYEDYFRNDWSDPRAMLFWQRAIGSTERLFPANTYRQHVTGSIIPKKNCVLANRKDGHLNLSYGILRRGLWVPTDFYPRGESRLGFDFAIGAHAGGVPAAVPGGREGARGGRGAGGGARRFEAYVNQKQLAYRAYSAPRLST